MSFDNKLTNARGALSEDRIAYAPINFQITAISNPSVTVKNADAAGNTFVYNQTLALGQTSAAKNLQFNDPAAQLFTFDAKITANAFFSSTAGTGSQNGDGTSNPPAPVTYGVFHEVKTGTLLNALAFHLNRFNLGEGGLGLDSNTEFSEAQCKRSFTRSA